MKIRKPAEKTRPRQKAKARLHLGHPSAFKDYDDDVNIHQSMVGFLQDVWHGSPPRSYLFVASSDPEGQNWREHVIRADDTTVGLNRFLLTHPRWKFNLYFCPNPFSHDRRRRDFALPSRMGWCDMDDSDPWKYQPVPSLIWETSPDRYQGLWLWNRRHSADEAERFSRSLAERHGGDVGWSITKMLRVPGSINHKPQYNEPFVRLEHRDWNRVEERPEIGGTSGKRKGINATVLDFDHEAFEKEDVLRKYRRDLHPKARALIRNSKAYEPDRSAQIYHMVTSLKEAGAFPDEIASVIWNSPYFQDKYPDDVRALHAELSRILSKIGRAS